MVNSNYYKLKKIEKGMVKEEIRDKKKKGQVAIFVIIAIVVVAVILFIALYPNIRSIISPSFSPGEFLKSCIMEDYNEAVDLLSSQGGYSNPEGFKVYNDQKIKYLCYTSEYYKTCAVQQPMITTHFEQEMDKLLSARARVCLNNLKIEYEKRGYSVTGSFIDAKTTVQPGKINIVFDAPMSITKESTQRFDKTEVNLDSEMFDILAISQSIVEFEAFYGDSEITTYMEYYPNIKVEKNKLSDGTKIYTVTSLITDESFVFASRSLSWPPGYGVI